MSGCRLAVSSFQSLNWRLIVYVALCALCGRALIPAGYMPSVSTERSGKIELSFCLAFSSTPTVLALSIDAPDPASEHADDALVCPFGVLTQQVAIPSPSLVPGLVAPVRVAIAEPAARQTLPPLPATGPPLGSRAPPSQYV